MSKVVLQLGYGMQGRPVLSDLLRNPAISKIIVTDVLDNVMELPKRFNDPRIFPVKLDVKDRSAVVSLMKQADVVVDLMPGFLTLEMAKLAVEVGINLVSTMYLFNAGEQDPAKREAEKKEIERLSDIAKEKNITVIEELGMDPGMDLILGWQAVHELDEVKVFHSYGAGFPELSAADNPLRYKFTWSILGVMRSYLRPATVLKNGEKIEIPADEMFAPRNTHLLKLPDFDEPLECFANGDSASYAALFGLKKISSMGRYIARWGGHGAFWHAMAKSGFLSGSAVKVGSVDVIPEIFCESLLSGQEQFYYKENERDVALVRSDVRGYKDGKPLRVVLQVLDYRDLSTGLTSMQRTVGFSASIGAQMILDGTLNKKGIVSPVEIPFQKYSEELQKRGITFTRYAEEWSGNENPEL